MNDKPKEPRYDYDDEIDLYELWLKITKRWKLILIVVLIVTLSALIISLNMKPVYKGTFVIRTPVVTPKEVKKHIEKLEVLKGEQRVEELADILKVPVSLIENTVKISTREIRGVQVVLEVDLEVYDPKIIPPMASAIVSYLNSEPYIKERLEKERELVLNKIRETRSTIKTLIQAKKTINRFIKQGKELYFNPTEIDEIIKKYKDEEISLKYKLSLLKGIEISVDPVVPKEPYKPKVKLITTVAFLSSLFLGIFLALCSEWLSESRRRYENRGERT